MLRKALQTKRQLIEELNKRLLGEQETTEQQEDLGDLKSVTQTLNSIKEKMMKWASKGVTIPKTEVQRQVDLLHNIIDNNNKLIKTYCTKSSGKIKTSDKNIKEVWTSCKKLQAEQQSIMNQIRMLNRGLEEIPEDGIPSKKFNATTWITVLSGLLNIAQGIAALATPKPAGSANPFQ